MYSYILNIHDYDTSSSIELLHESKVDNFSEIVERSIDPMVDEWFREEMPRYDWYHGEVMIIDKSNVPMSISIYGAVHRLARYLSREGFTIREANVVASISFDDTMMVETFLNLSENEYRHKFDRLICESIARRINGIQKAPLVMSLDQYIEMRGSPDNEYELTQLIHEYNVYKDASDEYNKNHEK